MFHLAPKTTNKSSLYVLIMHFRALILLLNLPVTVALPFKLSAWSTGTTILGLRASTNVTILAADGRTTQGGAIASDTTVKLHDVVEPLGGDGTWSSEPLEDNSIDTDAAPPFTIPGYRCRLLSHSTSPTLATCAGAGTSGDVQYIISEVRSSLLLKRALGEEVTPKTVLESFVDNVTVGKKSCSLLLGRAGLGSCDCYVIDSSNGVRPVQRCVAMGSGGPYATAYMDDVLSRNRGELGVKEGVEVAGGSVLAGVRNDDFSGGHVIVVVLERGARQRRYVFEKESVSSPSREPENIPESDGEIEEEEILVVKGRRQREREWRELLDHIEGE